MRYELYYRSTFPVAAGLNDAFWRTNGPLAARLASTRRPPFDAQESFGVIRSWMRRDWPPVSGGIARQPSRTLTTASRAGSGATGPSSAARPIRR